MNKRIRQVAFIVGKVTNQNLEDAIKYVSETNVGKKIQRNNTAILYEQPSLNAIRVLKERNDSVKISISQVVNIEREMYMAEKRGELFTPKPMDNKINGGSNLAKKRYKKLIAMKKHKYKEQIMSNASSFYRAKHY